MSYFGADVHAAVVANAAKVEDYYMMYWKKFAQDLGSVDAGLVLGSSILPVAFAAIMAWDLKPYGPENGVDLASILASPTLSCDNYVRLTWYFTQLMPQVSWAPARIVAVGWNGGAVGNHAQMIATDGTHSLLLDPTTGLVAKGVTFDTLLQGKHVAATDIASFETYNIYPGNFTKTVKDAVMNGLYKPSDLLYYVDNLEQYTTAMPATSNWLTPQAAVLT